MKTSKDETQLAAVAKRLLATPHKPREESKVSKDKTKSEKSPRTAKAAKKPG